MKSAKKFDKITFERSVKKILIDIFEFNLANYLGYVIKGL